MRRSSVITTIVVLALALSSSGLAATGQGYRGQAGGVLGELQGGSQGQSLAASGSLPFSGQDLTLTVAAGVLLILAGGTFYRLSRRRS